MKRTIFASLFTILLTLSCVFASCNARDYNQAQDGQTNNGDTNDDYSSIIKDLEDQILELRQDQYISESKRTEEISRLEALIIELKQSGKYPSTSDTEKDTQDTESDTETDSVDTDAPSPTGKFLYTVENGTATITGYTGSDSQLTLPSSIDGYAVTAIADDAFTSDSLESITIPEGVTKIGWFAFKDCDALKSVTVPKSVESIGYAAFPSRAKGFSIICPAESFAAKYASSYGIAFTAF